LLFSFTIINYAFTNYSIGNQLAKEGYCLVKQSVLQQQSMYGPPLSGGDHDAWRVYYQVDFYENEKNDQPILTNMAAISGIDNYGWDTEKSDAAKEMEKYAPSNSSKYECVRGKKTVTFYPNDGNNNKNLIILGSSAKDERIRFLSFFIAGIVFGSLCILIMAICLTCLCWGRHFRKRIHYFEL
jgi:hypothetical protein